MYLVEGRILQNAKKFETYGKSFNEVNRCIRVINNWLILAIIVFDYLGLLLIYSHIDNEALQLYSILFLQILLYFVTFVGVDFLEKTKRKIVKKLKKYFYN